MTYITMSEVEFAALTRVAEPEQVASVQLSRRDSFDKPHPDGFLAVSVVPKPGEGEQFRVAIGDSGGTVDWPLPRTETQGGVA